MQNNQMVYLLVLKSIKNKIATKLSYNILTL